MVGGMVDRGVRRRRVDAVIVAAFLASFALARAGRVAERDPYWQIRAGAENLAGVPLARPDTWSWSGAAGDWYPNSPLWNVVLALAYRAGGFWGVFAFSALVLLVLLLLSAVLAARLGARPLPGLVGLFMVFAGALPYLGARATLGAQVIMVLAVYLGVVLSDAVTRLAVPILAALTATAATALSVLGNWIHLSFLLVGPGLALVWAAIWVLTPSTTIRVRAVLIAAGGLGWTLGPVLSPYGVAGGLARARAVQEAAQGLLTEWSSPFDPVQDGRFTGMVIVAIVVAAGALWWLWDGWRRGSDLRLPVALCLIGVPGSLAGLFALRFLGIGPVTLAPVVAAIATALVDRLRHVLGTLPARPWLRLAKDYTSGRFWRIVLAVVAVALSPAVVVLAGEHAAPPEQAALARLPEGCRVFSAPDIGGVVVLLRPDAPVWMDGRADFFGRRLLVEGITYWTATSASVVPEGTGCVLVNATTPLTTPLRARIATDPRWRLDSRAGDVELWLPAGQEGR